MLNENIAQKRIQAVWDLLEQTGRPFVTWNEVQVAWGVVQHSARKYRNALVAHGYDLPTIYDNHAIVAWQRGAALWRLAAGDGTVTVRQVCEVGGTPNASTILAQFERYNIAIPKVANRRNRPKAKNKKAAPLRCDRRYPTLPPPTFEAIRVRAQGDKVYYLLR